MAEGKYSRSRLAVWSRAGIGIADRSITEVGRNLKASLSISLHEGKAHGKKGKNAPKLHDVWKKKRRRDEKGMEEEEEGTSG